MATPTIIIGLGSSGYKMIKETQKLYSENFGKNKPAQVQYLYIETYDGEKKFVSDEDLDIVKVYTSIDNITLIVNKLKENEFSTNWLPTDLQLQQGEDGAGGIRPCDRLALWGTNKAENNFENVVTAIENANNKVRSYTIEGKVETKPVVYILGTLVGGTASGMFIDMAYLVRSLIENVAYVFGVFSLPPRPIVMEGNEVKYANAYSALKELDDYNSKDFSYNEKLPGGQTITENRSPYTYTQFISQEYDGGAAPSLKDDKALAKIAGLYMFLNIAGMHTKRVERLRDALNNGHVNNYGTFGLSAIQYPKDQIEEYISCELAVDLLSRWLDPTNANGKLINLGAIESKVENKWDLIIQEAFKKLDIVGDEDLIKTIEFESRKINSKNINESEDDHIKKIFSSNQGSQLYAKVKGNVTEAVNFIIDEIYDFNVQTLNDYENIIYAQKVLESVVKAIEKTIQFWKEQEMSSDVQSWENFLRNQCTWMLNNRNKSIFEQNNTLNDRMLSTFSFMKMHLLGKTLFELIKYMKEKDIPFKSNKSGKALPKLNDISKLYTILTEVKGNIDGSNATKGKMDHILDDINDTSIPILRVFSSGSFEKDIENSLLEFKKNTNIYSNGKTDITNGNLWDLFKNQDDLHNKLFDTLLNKYENNVKKSGAVGDYDVTKYALDKIDRTIEMASRGTKPFVSTSANNFTFNNSPYLPKLVISSNDASLSRILKKFNDRHFSDNDKFEIKEVKNIIVFYEEKAYPFVPLKNIKYIQRMKDIYENAPKSRGMSNEEWKNDRNAYVPVKTKTENN